jgi:undecaprenyl-diphosphatase
MPLTVLQYVLLGIIQGITEWIPISSSGATTLIMTNFFEITDLPTILQSALFLHLGTFFAALVYFRKDVWKLTRSIFNYQASSTETKKILSFLVISTIITGVLGFILLQILSSTSFTTTGKAITFFVGFLLLITGIFQIKIRDRGIRDESSLKKEDNILLGLVQGISVLPGLSRSGMTISTLLLRKFNDTSSLRLSFLMSLPVILIGNIFLNINDFAITNAALYGLAASFVFGLLTIAGLMTLSRRINFGWFVFIFAIVMMASILV